MNVLGVIPSRFGSSRFPGKPLIDLKGKSMIQRVYEGASACPQISKLVVATDDERILEHVFAFGGYAEMTANSHQSGTERCNEVSQRYPEMEVVLNIQGDEPLVNPKQLTQLIALFQDTTTEIATLVTPLQSSEDLLNTNRVKVVRNHREEALCFSRNPIPSLGYPSGIVPLKHLGLYAYRSNILNVISSLTPCEWEKSEGLEQLRWLYYGFKIRTGQTSIETPNIDTPEDVKKVLDLLP
ncbi:MAG: 3-deoxy-manno-octulosonate cytidylyltransferase [Flavobacteriales bacterium]